MCFYTIVELCGFTHQLHLQVGTFSTTPTKNPSHKSTKGNKILEAPAVECQALAYIIIALKLMLILDDHSEHSLSLRTSSLQSLFPTGKRLSVVPVQDESLPPKTSYPFNSICPQFVCACFNSFEKNLHCLVIRLF